MHVSVLIYLMVIIFSAPTIDVNDSVTLDLVTRAVNLPIDAESKEEPRLTLLTDFVSQVGHLSLAVVPGCGQDKTILSSFLCGVDMIALI